MKTFVGLLVWVSLVAPIFTMIAARNHGQGWMGRLGAGFLTIAVLLLLEIILPVIGDDTSMLRMAFVEVIIMLIYPPFLLLFIRSRPVVES